MSTYGTYSLSLEQQRLEELQRRMEEQRKAEVRREASRLMTETRQANRNFTDHMTQHFGQEAQQQAESLARQAEDLLGADPDQALELARRSLATVRSGMAQASRQAGEWSRQRIAAEEAVAILGLALDSELGSLISDRANGSRGELTRVARQLATAKAALRGEDFATATELASAGQERLAEIRRARHKEQEQEEVRREIVRGLRQVLTGMGFSVDRARLGSNSETGKVVLAGSLPSGRTARFLIASDGTIDYDFDGYHSSGECGKDSEKIRSRLEKQCQGQTTVVEVHWKDRVPTRLGKNARPIPTQIRTLAQGDRSSD